MTYLYAAPAHSSVTRARWEPMPLQPDHMLAGNPHPRVHWLRKNKPVRRISGGMAQPVVRYQDV